jgi:hypothetical protein
MIVEVRTSTIPLSNIVGVVKVAVVGVVECGSTIGVAYIKVRSRSLISMSTLLHIILKEVIL